MKINNRRALVRIGAGAAAVCAAGAMVGIAGPAFAEEPATNVNLGVIIPGPEVAVGSAGKNIRVDVFSFWAGDATNVKVTLEVADVTDAVTVTLPGDQEGCATEGTKVVCDLGDLPGGATDTGLTVLVTPKKGADLGPVGKLTATVSSAERDEFPDDNTASVTLQLVSDAVDLIAYSADVTIEQGPEGAFLAFGVENDGSVDVPAVDVGIVLPGYVEFAEKLDYCEYDDEFPGTALCHYEGLEADVGGGDAIPVRLESIAPGPRSIGGGFVAAIGREGINPALARGGPKRAEFGKKQSNLKSSDASPGDDIAEYTVFAGPNKMDNEITSTPAQGHVGDTVDVAFRYLNKGPATGGAGLKIKAPAGTVILDTDEGSITGPFCLVVNGQDVNFDFGEATEVECNWEGETPPNTPLAFTLKFRINSSPVGDDGKIEAFDLIGTPDPDLSNNTAPIVITILDGSGGGLPVTGVQVGVIGVVGVAVVVAGALLVLMARRRRIVPVLPNDGAGE